ncbi:MAG: hypothetical protein GX265_02620 [Mollicutes bacterium]|nr:hypothetical protein [Mollicutes bacterium]
MKKNTALLLSFIVVTLIVTIGISFAYFTAQFTGGETTDTITVTGGRMNITYDGGPNINIANIIPDNSPAAIKTFTVTGNNNTEIPMGYKLSLVVEANDFSEEALKYKLNGTNTDNNGTVAPNIDMTNIGTGTKTIELGTATFDVPTGGNKIHTYRLEIYFPNQEYNQNIDQEKTFGAYVLIENYTAPQNISLHDAILAQGGGAATIESKGNPNFTQIATSTDTGLYASLDEYGTSYYYRGQKDLLNNNVIWGGFQWKIIRINGDGSIRLLYNGTEEEFNIMGYVNSTGLNTQIGTSTWNSAGGDNKYIGYMYGGTSGVSSSSREEVILNETNSNIKTYLETWYQNSILGKSYESQVADNLFCNNRTLLSGQGYGVYNSNYGEYYNLSSKLPSLKCPDKNDRFTKEDTEVGNGNLEYPIGLVTNSELIFGGLAEAQVGTSIYLTTNQNFWTFSPYNFYYPNPTVIYLNDYGSISSNGVSGSLGVRPVLSIKGNVRVTGDGSMNNPFKAI